MKRCLQKILCCLKPKKVEQEQEQAHDLRMDKDYIPNHVAQRLSLDSKSSYSESYDNSEDILTKINIVQSFKKVYEGETPNREFDLANNDFSLKKAVQHGKEMYLNSVERQKIIRAMEVLYLEEATKVEVERSKLLKNKSADLDIIHMSYNKELKLKAEDNIASSIAVASIEEDLNKEQIDILRAIRILQKQSESLEEEKNNKILSQINITENRVHEEYNIFNNPFEQIIAKETITDFIRVDNNETLLIGMDSDNETLLIGMDSDE